jgi:hypothetical protein
MAGLVPAIHVFLKYLKEGVDHRDKPGDDDGEIATNHASVSSSQSKMRALDSRLAPT